jgi:hypothetical protein
MPSAASRQSLSELVAKILDQLAVSAWLPAGVLVVLGVAIGSLRAANGHVSHAIASLGSLSLSALVLLVIGIVLATVLTQAFQFEAIRVLEGYWGPGSVRTALTEAGCRRHLKKRCQGSRELPRCDHGFSPPVIAGRSARIASRWARMR